jgi:hypothetical protein
VLVEEPVAGRGVAIATLPVTINSGLVTICCCAHSVACGASEIASVLANLRPLVALLGGGIAVAGGMFATSKGAISILGCLQPGVEPGLSLVDLSASLRGDHVARVGFGRPGIGRYSPRTK